MENQRVANGAQNRTNKRDECFPFKSANRINEKWGDEE